MIVGFTVGSFDLCHFGHVLMFEECIRKCDWLVVFVQDDPSVDRPEKNRPVQSLEERVGQVRALRGVDEVRTYTTEASLLEGIRDLQRSCLDTHRKIRRFIGEDWRGKHFTGWDLQIEVVYTPRDHTYSTSELRERIFQAETRKRSRQT